MCHVNGSQCISLRDPQSRLTAAAAALVLDGNMDGLLRQRRLEQHVRGCRSPLPWSLEVIDTALESTERAASHGGVAKENKGPRGRFHGTP